jgi:hypothetical protein
MGDRVVKNKYLTFSRSGVVVLQMEEQIIQAEIAASSWF